MKPRPTARFGTTLRRVARPPRRWAASLRTNRRTEAVVETAALVFERGALAARARRGRSERRADWAKMLERIEALPPVDAPARKIQIVRIPDDAPRFPPLPVDRDPIDSDTELICFVLASSTTLETGWLARLAAVVDGTTVVAAMPLVVHPLRAAPRATPHDGRVRARGLSIAIDGDAPALHANDAGATVTDLLGSGPVPVIGGTAACLLVDRRAYEAATDRTELHGPTDPDDRDLDLAVFDLGRRLSARGGLVVAVADSVVVDHRDVRTRVALAEPISTKTSAWRSYVEACGPQLLRAASPLPDGGLRIALTVAAPSEKVAPRWGDWHLAQAFARSLRRRGHVVRVQTLDHADDLAGRSCDVHCVVRGLAPVRRTPGQAHVLWIISHPEDVTAQECDRADLVLVASERFATELRRRTRTPVEVMLQATDISRFRPVTPDPEHAHDVAIVAKSRGVFRTSVAAALAEGIRPAIYGGGWEPFVDQTLVVSTHVANDELPIVYSSVGVLLNDHWQTMHEWGFASNRLFDALACGTPVISDDLPELAVLFDGTVLTYHDPGELRKHVESVLSDPAAARTRAARGREIVTEHHTFDHRAAQLLDALRRHGLDPARSGVEEP